MMYGGGFTVGSKPTFEDLAPIPYEHLFCLLLTGSKTVSPDMNVLIFEGISWAKGYLRPLTEQEKRRPIRFLRSVLENCLADKLDGIDPKQQLQELTSTGPQLIG